MDGDVKSIYRTTKPANERVHEQLSHQEFWEQKSGNKKYRNTTL